MTPKGIRLVFASVCLALAFSLATRAQQPLLAGDWTGESICVGEIGACHDEPVLYHISVDSSDPTKVKISADKIVAGTREFMGDILLKYDAAQNILTGEFQSPRSRGVWEFTVKGNMMWGTLSLLPEKRIVRQIRVTKSESNQGTTQMTQHATGTFEVKLVPQDDKSEDQSLGRMTITKQWEGDIQGASTGQMLTGGDFKTGSAGYVAMEKFTGTLKGRKGSFILQHSATMTKSKGDLTITVVPDSGTEALKGITGQLAIKIENGKHFYEFEYSIVPSP